MALVYDENGNLIDTGTTLPQGLQGRNRPRVAPAAVVAPPVAAPAQGLNRAQVRQQDRVNTTQFVESQPSFVGAPQALGAAETTLSPNILADANQRIAQTLREGQGTGPMPGAERGVFNQQTTSRVSPDGQITSTLPRPQSEGLTGLGQFGAVSPAQYLAGASQFDQARTERRLQAGQEARLGLERSALQADTTRGSATSRAAARQALRAFETQQGAQALQNIQETGATRRAGLQTQAELARAQVAGAAGLASAQAQAAGRLQQAQLTGEYGLASARERAAGTTRAAQVTATSPQAQLAAERARQLQIQQQILLQAQEAGDISGTFAAAGLSRPPAQVYIDPITGAPLSEEQVRLLQQQGLSRLSTPQ